MRQRGSMRKNLPENEALARERFEPFFSFLLFEFVPVNHSHYPLSNIRVYFIYSTLEERQQLLAQRLASDHPLVVVPASVMVRAVQL